MLWNEGVSAELMSSVNPGRPPDPAAVVRFVSPKATDRLMVGEGIETCLAAMGDEQVTIFAW
jgi:hypothetical protein